MSESSPVVRCAIYTRKSTEEGLEQQFNSLQAQRESAEAYILSQKQNGWQALARAYNDGGYSGASIERPALEQLLSDIEARRIDCVVVYKVDRLSRSLLDFARLLSLFDKRGVSFVSVTQDFNTSTSMGRLTLNILLSFAQFEREIIGERTRDKLSAARRKGKWIGGFPVLGYDVAPEGGRLVVNPAEAEQVRGIFSVCAACSTMTEALRAVRARGWMAKQWTSERGKQHGGQLLGMSTLKLLLTNVLYRGDISHKGAVYPGEHEAIVSRELWVEVNGNLRLSRTISRSHVKVETLLENLLACGQCGSLLRTSFTQGQGQRHVYYVCRAGKKRNPACPQRPVACLDLDRSLRERLERMRGALPDAVAIQQLLHSVSYDSVTRRVSVELRDGSRFEYLLPLPVRPGLRQSEQEQKLGRRTPNVSRLVALAIQFQKLVSSGTVRNYRELAEVGHVSRPRWSQIMKLAQLAPEIQEKLLFLPPTLEGPDRVFERHLRFLGSVVDWEKQKELFRTFEAEREAPDS
jgi:DNA invertase Pin-like site-specific DNA recombinase